MTMRKVVVCSVFLLSCGAAVVVPQATVTPPKPNAPEIAPIGEKSAYPTPPRQTAPWTPPSSALPPSVVAAATTLFDRGLADPRGCAYREIEIVLGDVWNGGGDAKKTHGFVFGDGAWAVAWNGLVYRVKSVGPVADLQADAKVAEEADD